MRISPIIALALCATCSAQYPAIEPDLEVALGTVGLNSRTARFDSNLLKMFRQGEFTTPLYDACYENPWRTPLFLENLRRELISHASRPQETISVCARMLGIQCRRSLVANPNAAFESESKKDGALEAVLTDWKSRGWISGSIPSLANVPNEAKSAAALILSTVPQSLSFRRAALKNVGDTNAVFKRLTLPSVFTGFGEAFDPNLRIYETVDLPFLISGAYDLNMAVQEAQQRCATVAPNDEFEVRIATALGEIVLSGGTDSVHSKTALLIIDCGGKDTYVNLPANRTASNPISVVIDVRGDDSYVSDSALKSVELSKATDRKSYTFEPGPGAALLGYATLVDRDGKDLYRSLRPAFGSATLGVSNVQDMSGDDLVDAYANSHGFALFGLGIWEDHAGSDVYRGFNQVQGCGQTMGVGLVMDREGNDQFLANDTEFDFPSAQSASHNTSMAQGCGNGRRADYQDGHSLSGGVGFLIDLAGDDQYSCGVFGQGAAYWMSVGYLFDGAGKDTYSGQWYVQGASAHFAMAMLEDDSGNDTYSAPMNMAQGAGHDFGMGLLFDRGGADSYTAPNLSLGAGNANGLGWFYDQSGNDTYKSSGITLGSAAEAPKSTLRMRGLCFGLFMDMGGDDIYPASASWAKNASRTAQIQDRQPVPAESQFGVFWDR